MKIAGPICALWLCCNLFANINCEVGDNVSSTDHPPSSSSSQQPDTTTSKQPDTATTTSNQPEVSRELKDVSNHRNVGLINRRSCGRSSKIGIGGGNTTGVFEMPWIVYLSYHNYETPGKELVTCGGTLINDRYVLTAAHCMLNYTKYKLVEVRLGEHDTSTTEDCENMESSSRLCAPPPQNIKVESFVKHPGYSPKTFQHDIGLIRLAEAADLVKDSINTICLPVSLAELTKNLNEKSMLLAGWGLTPQEGVANATVVKKALVSVVPPPKCKTAYQPHGVNIDDNHVCAREIDLDEQRPCAGISGGGSLQTAETVNGATSLVQYGILAFGNRLCDHNGVPDVYLRVSHYMDWILDNLAL